MKKRVLLALFLSVFSLCLGCGDSQLVETESGSSTETMENAVVPESEMPEVSTTEVKSLKRDYSFSDQDLTMYAVKTSNVRDLPTKVGNIVGKLMEDDQVHVIGICNETGWYKIDFDTEETYAFVSGELLSESPLNESETDTEEACPYDLLKLYDDGGKEISFYYVYDGSNDFTALFDQAKEILVQRGYETLAWDYEYLTYDQLQVVKCNVFYGEFIDTSTGLNTFSGNDGAYMKAVRY